jgi:2-[(L-alanin-3-ylcarbamoyl)methyl]-2-hydroxybutanedioate decarboxylase
MLGAVPARVVEAILATARPICAYVYDTATLAARARTLRAALPAGSLLCYAMKANSHPGVVAALLSDVDGLEVASGGELALAQQALARQAIARHRDPARRLVFAGPGKTDRELLDAIRAGATINAESVHELRRLAHLATGAGRATGAGVPVGLRVNRAHDGPRATLTMTGVPTPFGIDEAELPDAVAAVLPPLRLDALHLHAMSNNLDAAAHASFVRDALSWAVRVAKAFSVQPPHLNLGGGFGIDYTGTEEFDLDALRDGLAGLGIPPGVRLLFEPGRWLAGPAGWYAAEVLDVKRTHGRWFVVLRGGTHHFRLPAAWGYSHPFTVLPVDDWPYPFHRPEVTAQRVDVVGELCTPRDVLARDAPVGRIRAGDVLVFANTGAYGWDTAHHDFLRHQYPDMMVI